MKQNHEQAAILVARISQAEVHRSGTIDRVRTRIG
jgi:hypothetical protein